MYLYIFTIAGYSRILGYSLSSKCFRLLRILPIAIYDCINSIYKNRIDIYKLVTIFNAHQTRWYLQRWVKMSCKMTKSLDFKALEYDLGGGGGAAQGDGLTDIR